MRLPIRRNRPQACVARAPSPANKRFKPLLLRFSSLLLGSAALQRCAKSLEELGLSPEAGSDEPNVRHQRSRPRNAPPHHPPRLPQRSRHYSRSHPTPNQPPSRSRDRKIPHLLPPSPN